MNRGKAAGGAPMQGAMTPVSLAEARLARLKAIPFDRSKYEVVRDLARLKAWIVRAIEHGHVAIDTETNSLDPMQATLCGFSLAVTPNEACYVPLSHKKNGGSEGLFDAGLEPHQIAEKDALDTIKPLLEDPGVLKIGQNLKFDLQIFAQRGITIAPYDDTMLMSYVVDAGRSDHGLGPLARRYFDHTVIDFNEVTKAGKTKVTFDCVEIGKAAEYAAEDADVTLRLWHVLKPRLAAEHMTNVYETLERPMVQVLAGMEGRGISIDRQTLARLSSEFAQRTGRGWKTKSRSLPVSRSIRARRSSSATCCSARWGCPAAPRPRPGMVDRRQGAGRPRRAGPRIAAEDSRLAAGLEAALDLYRRAADLCRSEDAARPHQLLARRHHHRAAVIVRTESAEHPDPHRSGAQNPQGLRRDARQQAGLGGLFADRIAAAGGSRRTCRRLRQAFKDGIDIHAMTASEMFGVPVKDMPGEVRRRAKAINFGIIYGISAFGLANQLGIEREEAGAYIKKYFERFPGIRDYMDETREFCREHGYVETLFGRKCHYPDIASRIRRSAPSTNAPRSMRGCRARPPTSSAARWCAWTTRWREAKLSAQMLLQVHDELVFEVPDKDVAKTLPVVKRVMEDAPHPAVQLHVPLQVDARAADNWDEAH